jgi:hypothetical protein
VTLEAGERARVGARGDEDAGKAVRRGDVETGAFRHGRVEEERLAGRALEHREPRVGPRA